MKTMEIMIKILRTISADATITTINLMLEESEEFSLSLVCKIESVGDM